MQNQEWMAYRESVVHLVYRVETNVLMMMVKQAMTLKPGNRQLCGEFGQVEQKARTRPKGRSMGRSSNTGGLWEALSMLMHCKEAQVWRMIHPSREKELSRGVRRRRK